jgi:hypothetical protein
MSRAVSPDALPDRSYGPLCPDERGRHGNQTWGCGVTARTYYPYREPTFASKPKPETPFTDPDPAVIRYGYTLRDLDQLTHGALKADRLIALDYTDRRDIAWSAIAEALCTAEEAPTRLELIRVGWQAIARTVRDGYRQRGYQDGDYGVDGAVTMPRFVQFWGSAVTGSHEDAVVERLTLPQVIATLTPPMRDAIAALAMADDYMRAANLLGINYTTFTARVRTARRQILSLWHEGETPYRSRRTDRRVAAHTTALASHCSNGHEWTPDNTRVDNRMVRGRPRRTRQCRQCEHERSVRRSRCRSGKPADGAEGGAT